MQPTEIATSMVFEVNGHDLAHVLDEDSLPGSSLNGKGLVSVLVAQLRHHFIQFVAKLEGQRPFVY